MLTLNRLLMASIIKHIKMGLFENYVCTKYYWHAEWCVSLVKLQITQKHTKTIHIYNFICNAFNKSKHKLKLMYKQHLCIKLIGKILVQTAEMYVKYKLQKIQSTTFRLHNPHFILMNNRAFYQWEHWEAWCLCYSL